MVKNIVLALIIFLLAAALIFFIWDDYFRDRTGYAKYRPYNFHFYGFKDAEVSVLEERDDGQLYHRSRIFLNWDRRLTLHAGGKYWLQITVDGQKIFASTFKLLSRGAKYRIRYNRGVSKLTDLAKLDGSPGVTITPLPTIPPSWP